MEEKDEYIFFKSVLFKDFDKEKTIQGYKSKETISIIPFISGVYLYKTDLLGKIPDNINMTIMWNAKHPNKNDYLKYYCKNKSEVNDDNFSKDENNNLTFWGLLYLNKIRRTYIEYKTRVTLKNEKIINNVWLHKHLINNDIIYYELNMKLDDKNTYFDKKVYQRCMLF